MSTIKFSEETKEAIAKSPIQQAETIPVSCLNHTY